MRRADKQQYPNNTVNESEHIPHSSSLYRVTSHYVLIVIAQYLNSRYRA